MSVKLSSPFSIGSLLVGLLFVCFPAHADDEWEFIVAPYGLLPNISGDASVGRVEGADVDVDTGDILDTLELGGMIYFEALHESGLGGSVNYSFMDLGDKAEGPAGLTSFEADVFQGVLEAYFSYRLVHGESPIDLYYGMRWWDIDVDVSFTGPTGNGVNLDHGDDWIDPVIGARWQPRISEDWQFTLKGDVGGFGLESDYSWNIQLGFMWHAADYLSVVFQYRALAVDYSSGVSGTATRFAYDTITQGPLLGLAFRF